MKRIAMLLVFAMLCACTANLGASPSPSPSSEPSKTVSPEPPSPSPSEEVLTADERYARASILREGNLERLAAAINKAKSGEPVTVVCLGDSITAGSLATGNQGYVSMLKAWFDEKLPGSNVTVVNAGIGATTSLLGVYRADKDVLALNPDIVVVEFINDKDSDQEPYESLTRKLLNGDTHPAVVLFEMMHFDTGAYPSKAHGPVTVNYDLPTVSVHSALWDAISSGELKAADISPDNLHPNDRGHAYLASFLTRIFDIAEAASVPAPSDFTLPAPQTKNRYEKAVTFGDEYKWKGEKSGDKTTFKVSGSMITMQYRMLINNGADASISIDGNEPIIISAKFDGGWGNYLELASIVDGAGEHELVISQIGDGTFEITALMGVQP